MPDDPMVLVLTALMVVWLILLLFIRHQLKTTRRSLAANAADLTELFSDLNDLRIDVVQLHHPARPAIDVVQPSPTTMPITIGAEPVLDWVDDVMGQQPVPDPDPNPPTAMIPRVPATRHNPSEPKTTTISVAEIRRRLKAEMADKGAE